ncbi:hypothetical protein [Phycisphaera mikurensis]|uniref:YHS domain-containing protein n=1 Tax=Phycisphaera mikurensis (strain NBRC 102666 / KCTC 22515 / FYK2301M01) TaxID=1142394 RepID=I0IGM4_PHYMF|nr:hypothetical protein [Phycisphaera mikurensis]MBB6442906.1 YHS domain-containing protein [Phycisphaera mikurensis]BAM04412.1 hypothetical protein PSMK_22530 [Phycisphaera mikurensis NBRC 102666]
MKLFLLPALALLLAAPALPLAAAEPPQPRNVYPLPHDPVSGEPLAGVDQPVYRTHEGRRFHFASEASAEAFAAAPGDFIPAVDERLIATQSRVYPMQTCAVAGGALGSMGEPVDVLLGHRLVKLCCAGCRGAAVADPEAAIEKLDAAVLAARPAGDAAETCPVTGMKLGSMGEPVDIVFAGELVRFCCGGCTSKFLANPAMHLQKIEGAGS